MGGETPKAIEKFNKNAYMGRWYEAYRTKDMRFEFGECTVANYTL